MLGDAARTLLDDPDRLILFICLVGWLTIDNVRTRLFKNTIVGVGAAVVVADLALFHSEILVECLIAAAGVFVILMAVELAWPASLGMGTVKASALIALFLGYMSAVALLIGGALGAVFWIIRRNRDERQGREGATGPGMLIAAVLAIVIAQF
jgi:hypothetical protein